ncbi:MAG: efflux RND transporter periplasmic adaptor subunit [Deltaproteobacteria bacterium]|nr:efflux RND transporter periplasmic adaptor subunit [Deltaproteobacteria bacterium]
MKNNLLLLLMSFSFICAAVSPQALGQDNSWSVVQSGDLSTNLRVSGQVIPQEGALSIVSARVQGRITALFRKDGEYIQEGSALFGINSPECLSLVEEKRVAQSKGLSDLLASVNHREKLLGISAQENSCRLMASSKGILSKRAVELGANFNVGDNIATLIDTSRLTVELDVPERDLYRVKPGLPVKVELASKPGLKLESKIEQVLPVIETSTRTLNVRLRPLPLPAGSVPDALVFADIDIESINPDSILKVLPSALVFSHNKQYVLKKEADKTLAIEVEILSENDQQSLIRVHSDQNLKVGDWVLSKGALLYFNQMNSGAQ